MKSARTARRSDILELLAPPNRQSDILDLICGPASRPSDAAPLKSLPSLVDRGAPGRVRQRAAVRPIGAAAAVPARPRNKGKASSGERPASTAGTSRRSVARARTSITGWHARYVLAARELILREYLKALGVDSERVFEAHVDVLSKRVETYLRRVRTPKSVPEICDAVGADEYFTQWAITACIGRGTICALHGTVALRGRGRSGRFVGLFVFVGRELPTAGAR